MANRQFGNVGNIQRNVIKSNTLSSPLHSEIGEKRKFTYPADNPSKMQRTSNGYVKLFNDKNLPSPNNITKDTNINNTNTLQKQTTHLQQRNVKELPNQNVKQIQKPQNIKESNRSNGYPGSKSSTYPNITSPDKRQLSSNNNLISDKIITLQNEVLQLKSEIKELYNNKNAYLNDSNNTIDFLKTQLIESENERRRQSNDFWKNKKQDQQLQQELYERLSVKENELKEILHKIAFQSQTTINRPESLSNDKDYESSIYEKPSLPSESIFSDDEDDNLGSQESLQALCRTQQVQKKKKKQKQKSQQENINTINTNTNNNVLQKRLNVIQDILNLSDNDIEHVNLFNNENMQTKQDVSNNNTNNDILSNKEKEEFKKQIQELQGETGFYKSKIEQKELENTKLKNGCANLAIKIESIQESRETLQKTVSLIKKQYEEKFHSMKSLAYELKQHIESQQSEIKSLKSQLKEKQNQNQSLSIVQSKPNANLNTKPNTTPQLQKAIKKVRNISSEHTEKEKRKNSIEFQKIQSSKNTTKNNGDYNNKTSIQHPPVPPNTPVHAENDSQNKNDDNNDNNDINDSNENINNTGNNFNNNEYMEDDDDDEIMFESQPIQYTDKNNYNKDTTKYYNNKENKNTEDVIQPILSVEQYAAQAYSRSMNDNMHENTITSPQAGNDDNDTNSISLSQEMDSILGMSQYSNTVPSRQHLASMYDLHASPIHDLNADPYVRESTTKTALSKLESVSSQ